MLQQEEKRQKFHSRSGFLTFRYLYIWTGKDIRKKGSRFVVHPDVIVRWDGWKALFLFRKGLWDGTV